MMNDQMTVAHKTDINPTPAYIGNAKKRLIVSAQSLNNAYVIAVCVDTVLCATMNN